jgi:hypothetical protein
MFDYLMVLADDSLMVISLIFEFFFRGDSRNSQLVNDNY